MSIWFNDEIEIYCPIENVIESLKDYGRHCVDVVRSMPGITSAELMEEGSDHLTLSTNEGMMNRRGIIKKINGDSAIIEFDEDYQAGTKVNVKSHHVHEFKAKGDYVQHRIVISDVKSPGLIGFFYRKFGKASIGSALLVSSKKYLESSVNP